MWSAVQSTVVFVGPFIGFHANFSGGVYHTQCSVPSQVFFAVCWGLGLALYQRFCSSAVWHDGSWLRLRVLGLACALACGNLDPKACVEV